MYTIWGQSFSPTNSTRHERKRPAALCSRAAQRETL